MLDYLTIALRCAGRLSVVSAFEQHFSCGIFNGVVILISVLAI